MEAVPIYNVNPGAGSFGGWEALALMNQNRGGYGGYGMEGGWFAWIIILLLFGWGGRGGNFGGYGGNGCGCGCGGGYGNFAADLAVGNATATARNEAGLDFIGQGVNGIRNTLCEQNVNLCNQFSNVINAVNTNGYQTQLGQRDLQAQIANCCCQTQQSISAVNNNISQQFGQLNYNIALGNCDIKNAIHAEGEATRALMQSQYTQSIERKLAEANQQLFVLENFGQFAGKKNCGCGIPATACGCAC